MFTIQKTYCIIWYLPGGQRLPLRRGAVQFMSYFTILCCKHVYIIILYAKGGQRGPRQQGAIQFILHFTVLCCKQAYIIILHAKGGRRRPLQLGAVQVISYFTILCFTIFYNTINIILHAKGGHRWPLQRGAVQHVPRLRGGVRARALRLPHQAHRLGAAVYYYVHGVVVYYTAGCCGVLHNM